MSRVNPSASNSRLMSSLSRLVGHEVRRIRRDAMLPWMVVFPLVMALLIRFLVRWVESRFDFELLPHYPLIISAFAAFVAPVLIGYIVGVLLLDERDEGTLQYLCVTPVPLWKYLCWKLVAPVVCTAALTVFLFPVVGLMPFRWSYLPAILVGALWAPLLALLMGCFAQNKLQGFVLMRFSNLLLALPMLAWFFPDWEPILAVFPAYWPMKSIWLAAATEGRVADGYSALGVATVGFVIHGLLIAWLYRRFQSVLRS